MAISLKDFLRVFGLGKGVLIQEPTDYWVPVPYVEEGITHMICLDADATLDIDWEEFGGWN